jgi:hypothetical protein
LKCFLQVLHVSQAQIGRFLICLEVVVPVRQAKPTLVENRDYLRCILKILTGAESEERAG